MLGILSNNFLLLKTFNELLAIYLITTALSMTVLISSRTSVLTKLPTALSNNLFLKASLSFIFLNLAGVPPLPGFFIKIIFLINFYKTFNLIIIGIMVILNFTAFYLYTQYVQYVFTKTKYRYLNASVKTIQLNSILLISYVNFYPIYNIIGSIL